MLFASTARNLALTTNGTALSARMLDVFNVFLRDRTNGTTKLVSANLSGDGGNGDSFPAGISSDGRYAVFESNASDLVPGDTNNATDVLIRDVVSATTSLVSINTNGVPGNGASHNATVTPDGRYVAFASAASDLVPGDTNGISDAFVHDTLSGTTTLVSTGAVAWPNNFWGNRSEAPEITPDGRYVAFFSTASNALGAPLGGDIYVRDLIGGTMLWASSAATTTLHITPHTTAYAVSYNHRISTNGQFVAYEASVLPGASVSTIPSMWSGCILRYSLATGLTDVIHTNAFVSTPAYEEISSLDMSPDGRFVAFVANTNCTSSTITCVLLWDAQTGATTLVSGDSNNHVQSNSVCDFPAIDPTGRYVAFLSDATNLVTNVLNGQYHLYLRDTSAGTTTLLDADTNGVGSAITPLAIPRLNSLLTAFEASDGNLVPNDRNHHSDLFVRNQSSSGAELVSPHDPALASSTPNGPTVVDSGTLSRDGRWVAFASDADNLTPNDTNACRDVFVADLASGTNLLVSVATNGFSGDGRSSQPAITADGRYVAFTSSADNLVAGDTNKTRDVFLRDLTLQTTVLVSVNSNGNGSGNNDSFSPGISADGRFILFHSKTNLPGYTGTENLYLRDQQSATNYALSTSGGAIASMTPNGRFIAYSGRLAGLSTSNLYVWDSIGAARVYTNTTANIPFVAISPDGNRLAYSDGSQLYLADRAAGTLLALGVTPGLSQPAPKFSADSRLLVFSQPFAGTNQVYLYDCIAGTTQLISHRFDSTLAPATGLSDSPDISPDGRFIAYCSSAADVVPGNPNSIRNIILCDSQTLSNTLVSSSQSGPGSAATASLRPRFSADGQSILFESWAEDIAARDFNQSSHLFTYTLLLAKLTSQTGPGLQVSWKTVPGKTYHIQFKNNLNDPGWQDAVGSITNIGVDAYFQDSSPGVLQRFYRVASP